MLAESLATKRNHSLNKLIDIQWLKALQFEYSMLDYTSFQKRGLFKRSTGIFDEKLVNTFHYNIV